MRGVERGLKCFVSEARLLAQRFQFIETGLIRLFPLTGSGYLGVERDEFRAQPALLLLFSGGHGAERIHSPISHDVEQRARFQTLRPDQDRKSTRLNSSHLGISYAVFCLKKKKRNDT